MKQKSFANNFDFLRLLFAAFVIITHSYSLSGNSGKDILYQLSHGHWSFSRLGVYGFMVISGYLVYDSLLRSNSPGSYYYKRFLRLFPALAGVLLITVLLGPFVYHGGFNGYAGNISAWTYFPNNIKLFDLQLGITGIFETNPYPATINGSLWTLKYEFACYVVLSLLFFVPGTKTKNLVLISIFILLMFFANTAYTASTNFGFLDFYGLDAFNFGMYFLAGSFLKAINIERIRYKTIVITFSLLLLFFSTFLEGYIPWKFLLFALPVILFGLLKTPVLINIREKAGDLSYGLYLYGFPVQQALIHFFHWNTYSLMIGSLLISLVFAWLSWRLIEKPALSLKKSGQ